MSAESLKAHLLTRKSFLKDDYLTAYLKLTSRASVSARKHYPDLINHIQSLIDKISEVDSLIEELEKP